jgi:Ca2+-transporting ATPase
VLHSATALSADESILTGESLPVDKRAAAGASDAAARVYSGSLVVRGFGVAEITATGVRSEIGKIGRALATLGPEMTPLYREVRRVVRLVATAALALCALIAALYASSRNDWLGGVLAGVTVAMGVLPEEFPVVLTVFLAMGAWRISRVGVLTRRMPAIEAIGAATVLAVDKTGTLTENRMQLALIETSARQFDLRTGDVRLDDAAGSVLMTALAASEINAFDPMERAIYEGAELWIPREARELHTAELVREYDLTADLFAVTHVWRFGEAEEGLIAVKGAPETVLELCRVDGAQRNAWLARAAAHAGRGLRVLGVARGTHRRETLPASPREFELRLLGLICLADPLRSDVPAALVECARAGIRVVMITGDHPGTALAIAAEAGFDASGGALTGAELRGLSEAELRTRVRSVNIYARAQPDDKLRLVKALKENGEIIAMTGDGVNDAPALKAAHVGVAMGGRGSDVAREAAALVLVNDDFGSLVKAVRLGRRIYSNICHAMSYIISVHIPIAGLGLLPVLFGWPLLFFPVHVLFLEFVIDPACAFVFEADAESPDLMRRQPRPPGERLFSGPIVRRSVLLGAVVLAFAILQYWLALHLLSESAARALAFVAIVASNLALIFVSRSQTASLPALLAKPNRIFWWIAGLACFALVLTIYAPPVARVFQFAPPSVGAVCIVTAAGALLVLLTGRVLRQRT